MSLQTLRNDYIFDYVNDMVRKDRSGETISAPRFNRLLEASFLEFMEDEYKRWEMSQKVTDSFLSFYDESFTVSINTRGEGRLNLFQSLTNIRYFHILGVTSGATDVEILTQGQFDERVGSSLLFPTTTYPVCKLSTDYVDNSNIDPAISPDGGEVYIKVAPYSISTVRVDILFAPVGTRKPYYDFYYDANNNIIYLSEGQVHTWLAGERDSEGNPTTPGGMYNSLTQEIDMNDNYKMEIAYRILAKLGVIVEEPQASQLALRQEQKEEAP